MSDNPSPIGYELTMLLTLGSRAVIDELHRRLTTLGFDDVRPAHGFLFQRIAFEGASGNEIAEHLGITKQAASQMIDYLEKHDYVTRQPHPTDKRGKIVLLDDRGWSCVRATESILTSIEERWTDLLGTEQMEILRSNLRSIVYSESDDLSPIRLRPVW